MSTPKDRLRPPPAERFAGTAHLIDLASAVRTLRDEPHDGRNNHRQITVFHSGSLRIVLFAFEAGGSLPAHHAPGFVVIHTIRGAVSVQTPTETHKLTAGQILTLAPEIVHDVRADEESDILVTVSLTS
ncbi:MAG TPA: AraC family ligand binding domain-containing protein [Gemmatimonadaceae bacterium]|nr:AraC family ligand binding domain-containing protein [Gemmatimonadaceae bacterium]